MNLVVMSSSLPILHRKIFQEINPQEIVFSWMRSLIAIKLSSSPSSFIQLISKYNSGTNNRQWIALNVSTSEIWYADLIPGDSRSENITHVLLNQTYVISANRPFSDRVMLRSGIAHRSHHSDKKIRSNLPPSGRIQALEYHLNS